MTLKQLRAFITAVEEGTISKAAEVMGATQSGLTHLIIDLEEELGFSLMTRNKSGITLTEEGRRIYPNAKEICSGEDRLNRLALKIKGENNGKINIGTFSSVAVNWLPQIVNGFKKIYPDVEIGITDGGYGDIISAIEEGTIDLGFVALPISGNVKCYPLYKDRILAVLPKDHPLSKLNAIPVEVFKDEPVISLSEKTDLDSRRVFEAAGITPNIKYRTNDDYAMISMVENNLGICLEPELILSGIDRKVKVMETLPPSFRTIAIAVPYEKQANPYAVKLAEYIVEWVKTNA